MNETEFEAAIATTLREHAGGDVDTARLLYEAGARGRVLARRRRRAVIGAVAAAVALALAGAAGVVSAVRPAGTPVAPAGPTRVAGLPPPLPAAPDDPGAAQRPDMVASDPATLHFGWDPPANTTAITWEATPQFEQASAVLEERPGLPGGGLHVGVGRDLAVLDANDTSEGLEFAGPPSSEAVTVGGRPATLERQPLVSQSGASSGGSKWALRWQPVDGLWVRIGFLGGDDREAVLGFPAGLRLDRAQRCAVPFRLGFGPPNASLDWCKVRLGRELGPGASDPAVGLIIASQQFADGQGNTLVISTLQLGRVEYQPNRTIAGRPAQFGTTSDGSSYLTFADFDGLALTISTTGGWGEPLLTQLAEHLTVAPDLDDPSSWPSP